VRGLPGRVDIDHIWIGFYKKCDSKTENKKEKTKDRSKITLFFEKKSQLKFVQARNYLRLILTAFAESFSLGANLNLGVFRGSHG
jgi:hypothetical protein